MFGWGIDTGIPITTVRASPLPLLALFAVGTGFGAWWIGISYWFGLALGLIVPVRSAIGSDPPAAMRSLALRRKALGGVRVLLAPSLVVAAFWAAAAVSSIGG